MALNFIENRQIRIFISSTFKDMEKERDYLIKNVFPELRTEAAKRDVSIVELDLRWGIREEESKSGKVIEICLNEIENSHPFFIGLLGNRYGWQPGLNEIEKNSNLKERYPWIVDDIHKGLSVTEMEMQYGVLRNKTNMNANFYIKDKSLSVDCEDDTDESREKLRALKKAVMENGRYPYYKYKSIEEIGRQVKKDFTALLDKYFPEKDMSPLERERNGQRSVCHNLCTSYIPVEENFRTLDDFVHSDEKYFCIAAESGLGKSALIANWIKRLEEKGEYDVIYHFVGNSDAGNYYESILKRFIDEICERFSLVLTEDEKKKEAMDLINDVLFRIPKSNKLVLILDAINQINNADYAKQLAWLPAMPENVKLVLSTLPEDDTFAAITRRNIPTFTLRPLNRNKRIEMVNTYLKRHAKALTDMQVARIVDDTQNENTLALKTLLNQLISFGSHEELDNRINYYLEAETVPEFFQKVLETAEEDYGADLVSHILSLIALSRNGMAENELIKIADCLPINWSEIYCAFVMHFNIKNGLINFAHTYIEEAVINRYLKDELQVKKLRSEITSYFRGNKTPRAFEELPYQYCLMDNNVMLHEFLLDLNHFIFIFVKDTFELNKYWQKLKDDKQQNYSIIEYIKLIEDSNVSNEDKGFFYYALGIFSNTYIVDLELSQKCFEKALNIQSHLFEGMSPNTATCYDKIAGTYNSKGDYDKALEYYEKALNIRLQLFGEMNEYIVNSYNAIGLTYYSRGNYDKALGYFEKALNIGVHLFGEMSPDTSTSYNNIGLVYHSKGNYDKALEYHEKALNIELHLFGEMNTYTATNYSNIGATHNAMGDYDKALEYYEKALNIRLKLYGEMNKDTAINYSNIGATYDSMGKYDKAFEYNENALNIQLQLFGEMNPDTVRSYNNIGATYDSMGKYGKALEYYEKALNIELQLVGEMNPTTAQIYENIGLQYNSKGDYENALEYYEKALNIRLQLIGKINPDAAGNFSNIGYAYNLMGEYNKALEYYEKALNIRLQLYREMNPEIATNYNNIGFTYHSMGEYDKALKYYENALKIQLQLFGDLNPDTARSYNNIGGIYDSIGEYDKALEYYEKALSIQLKLLGEINPDTAAYYNNIGATYNSKGNYDKALVYYEKALNIRLQLFGEMNQDTAGSFSNIGFTYNLMGKYDKALEYKEKTLNIRLQLFGVMNADTATSYNNIGLTYDSMGDYDKALEYFEKSLNIQSQIFGETHPDIATNYNNIGFIYHSIGDYDKALEYFEKALNIQLQIFGEMNLDTAFIHLLSGNCLFEIGRYKEALELHEKSWNERTHLLGEYDEDTMISYEWTGRDYLMLNEIDKAMPILNKSLEYNKGTEREFLSLQYLAIAYGKLGDKGKAISLFEQGLRQLDDCNEDIFDNKGNFLYFYAKYLKEIGESAKALQLAENGLKDLRLFYKGHNHPYIDRTSKLIDDIKNYSRFTTQETNTSYRKEHKSNDEGDVIKKFIRKISDLFN